MLVKHLMRCSNFFYDKDNEIANLFNIQKIERDKVILKPYLLKTVK